MFHGRRTVSRLLLILCTLLAGTGAGAAEVALLDGTALQGDLRAWEGDSIEVQADEGITRLAVEQILRIRFASHDVGEPRASVELVDGSVLPMDRFTVADGEATVHVTGSNQPLVISTQKITAVHLLPPTPPIAAQWNDLRESDEVGDLIVIRKEAAVDHLAGRLGDVTDSHVLFYLDEDEYPVERSKVDGVVYFHAREPSLPEPLCELRGRDGLKLVASSVTLDDESLRVRTTGGVELTVPLDRIESADFSGGKVLYLSELTPRSASVTPLISLPESADLAGQFFEPVVGRGFFTPEAMLRHPRSDGEKIVGWDLQPHPQSIGLRSRSEVVYQLPEDFREFRGLAGIDGTLGGRGHVRLAFYGDDRLLWEEAVDGRDPPVTMELDVAGVRRLRVVVDYGEGGDAADRLYLCEARITK